jgi:hypothetical protein
MAERRQLNDEVQRRIELLPPIAVVSQPTPSANGAATGEPVSLGEPVVMLPDPEPAPVPAPSHLPNPGETLVPGLHPSLAKLVATIDLANGLLTDPRYDGMGKELAPPVLRRLGGQVQELIDEMTRGRS